MKIRIGVENSPRDFSFETDTPAAELAERLEKAIADGSLFNVEDTKGNTVLIPGAKVSYIEYSTEEPRRVGFLG